MNELANRMTDDNPSIGFLSELIGREDHPKITVGIPQITLINQSCQNHHHTIRSLADWEEVIRMLATVTY